MSTWTSPRSSRRSSGTAGRSAASEPYQAALDRFAAEGPSAADAERLRRAAYGASVSALQTPGSLAGSLLRGMLDEEAPFAMLDALAALDLDALPARAAEMFSLDRRAVAVLLPGERA